jgi:HD-like signal output (HDOD) protein/CheY-like chemotaxis protein
MTAKSILLAIADPQILADITEALGAGWEAMAVANEVDALAQLEQRSFDAILVDFNLGSPDASDLLNQATEKHPEIVQFLLAHEADLALVAAKVLGSPQILPKPIQPLSLKSRIDNAVTDSTSAKSTNDSAKASSDAPTIPPVYAEVLKAIESLGVSDEQIGEIIAQDPVLTFEVLRLTNSAYLGLPRNITTAAQAVQSLGLEIVKALVMALQFLAEHSRLKPGYLSLDQIWQHSVNVGQIARDLILFETKDRTLASQALVAGLLHDFGKVVLATNYDDLYGRVHSLARKQPVTLWDVEKEMFGANHGEIGACLAGMWNIPSPIVEAIAFSHEPALSQHEQFTPLVAVHIANVLEREFCPSDDELMVAAIIDTTFLNQLGLLQRLPVWRAAFANRRAGNLESEPEPAEADQSASTVFSSATGSQSANQLPGPTATTRTTTSGQSPRRDATPAAPAPRHRRTWLFASLAVVLVLAALWFRTQFELGDPEPVYARTPPAHAAPMVVSSTPSPETTPTPVPEVTPPVTVSAEAATPSEPPTEAVSKPAGSLSATEPTAAVPSPVVTNVPPPSPPPQEQALPEFRVNGIIYTSVRPSAILNGRTVSIGDQVNGATVVRIGRSDVTLQINGQRKTFELR